MLSVRLSNGQVVRVHRIPGGGVPWLFLHGLGCASSCDYPAVVSCPALVGKSAFLVDLLGYGFSDKPDAFAYTVGAQAEIVAELVQHLGLTAFQIYGHSMGGSIAIVAASLLQSRVRNLVLSEPNLDPGGGVFSRSIAAQAEAKYVRTGHERDIREAAAAGNLVWAGSMRVASALAVHRGATSLVRGSTPTWREILQGLKVPRTVLFGEHSLPDNDVAILPQLGVRIGIVAQAGHSMAWDNPAALAEAIANPASAPEKRRSVPRKVRPSGPIRLPGIASASKTPVRRR